MPRFRIALLNKKRRCYTSFMVYNSLFQKYHKSKCSAILGGQQFLPAGELPAPWRYCRGRSGWPSVTRQLWRLLITRNGSSFVLENHLNNRIINGVILQLIQGCRGTRVSLLSACPPTELTGTRGSLSQADDAYSASLRSTPSRWLFKIIICGRFFLN